MRRIRGRIGLKGFEGVDSNGMSGGLALFWHESCVVEILGKEERYTDALVRLNVDAEQWRVTFVYGEPRVENRHLMWSKLQSLKNVSDRPWLVIGDFNEALWDFEHLSASPRPEQQMIAFRDTLEVCGLVDLGFSGIPFTYDNLRAGVSNVKVRLDRATATNDVICFRSIRSSMLYLRILITWHW